MGKGAKSVVGSMKESNGWHKTLLSVDECLIVIICLGLGHLE